MIDIKPKDNIGLDKGLYEDLGEGKDSLLNDYNELVVDTVEDTVPEKMKLSEPVLKVEIETEEQLSFLHSLLEKEDTKGSMCLPLVIPIEGALKEIGMISLDFNNLISIRTYNPKIKVSILIDGKTKDVTDEDILCL